MIKFLNTTKTSYLVDDVYYSNTTSKQITQYANKLGLTKKRVKNLFDNMDD